MVTVKEESVLLGIINHCKRIEETVALIDGNECNCNDDIKDIICFNILQIGELAKHLSEDFLTKHPNVPWSKIKGMRDIIVHGYGTIKWERVWVTATEDVEPLREYCESILSGK